LRARPLAVPAGGARTRRAQGAAMGPAAAERLFAGRPGDGRGHVRLRALAVQRGRQDRVFPTVRLEADRPRRLRRRRAHRPRPLGAYRPADRVAGAALARPPLPPPPVERWALALFALAKPWAGRTSRGRRPWPPRPARARPG